MSIKLAFSFLISVVIYLDKIVFTKKGFKSLALLILGLIIAGLLVFLVKSTLPVKHKEESYRANYHFTVPDKWKNDPRSRFS